MKHLYLLIGLFILLPLYGQAQQTACNCDVTIAQSGTFDNKILRLKPGQTVCIQGGTYSSLIFKNFSGTARQPIRFVNCNGQVFAGLETALVALEFSNSSFFTLSGTGDSRFPYGFVAGKTRSGTSAVSVTGLSSDYEVDHVEVTGSGYAGFSMRLEPGCDSMTYQPNYAIGNVSIHDNYIHDVPATGMFLGSGQSATSGVLTTCNSVQKRVYPVQIQRLEVYSNRIEYTTGAGLTINNAPDASVHDNTIQYTNLGSVPPGWLVGGSAGCGCDYTISQSGNYNNYLLGVLPGKTVCLKAGTYNNLILSNFVGTLAQPIRFVNCGGLVQAGSIGNYSCLQVSGSRYISLSGSGDPAYEYGIKLASATSAAALSVGTLSSDCEIHHIEIAQSGFAGMMIKTDPNCDSTTWRNNFTMYNVAVHHNYIHDTKGEGIYAGNSFFGTGMTVTCNGVQRQVFPHLIYGLSLHHNRIERTGAEGIQYSCAPDASVHHNRLSELGIDPFAYGQNNGMQIGGGAGGDCYNNVIRKAGGMGIIVVGHWGNNRVYNNTISLPGGDGIFCDERIGSLPGTYVQFVNNTISGTGRDGIRLYNQDNLITIANNAITNWGPQGKPIVFAQGATATMVTNFMSVFDEMAGYADAANGDFSLQDNSILINAGTSAALLDIKVDQLDQKRPSGCGYDIGAHEYIESDSTGIHPCHELNASLNPVYSDQLVLNYPSPCHDQVTLRLRSGYAIKQIDVYNEQGQLVNQTFLPDGEEVVVLATRAWSAGIYTYRIYTGNIIVRGRILKI